MSFACRPIGLVKSAFVWRPTISADATNWVLYSQALAAGWDGVVPLDAEVTLSSGIVLSANSTSLYGFDTGSGFPAGTTLKAILSGYVCGMGGAGGSGTNNSATSTTGATGGPALRAQYAITIDATGGVIAGGGGGGGGYGAVIAGGGGGGGRGGRVSAAKGSTHNGTAATDGSFSIGGNGGYGFGGSAAAGGTTGTGSSGGPSGGCGGGGGGWGASGGASQGAQRAGGAGGAAVVGNSYITWINTGTRYGAIT